MKTGLAGGAPGRQGVADDVRQELTHAPAVVAPMGVGAHGDEEDAGLALSNIIRTSRDQDITERAYLQVTEEHRARLPTRRVLGVSRLLRARYPGHSPNRNTSVLLSVFLVIIIFALSSPPLRVRLGIEFMKFI